MKKIKFEEGITLIALIITIIILLILAVVTIGALQDGGIITHAKNATNKHTIEKEKEELELAIMEATMAGKGKFSYSLLDSNLPEKFTGSNGRYISQSGIEFAVNGEGNIDIVSNGEESEEDTIPPTGDEISKLEKYIFGEKLEGKKVSFLNGDPTKIIYEDDLTTADIDESKYVSLIDGYLTGTNGNKANYTTYIDVGDGKYKYDYYVQYDENGTTVKTNPDNGLTKLKLETTERLGKYVKYDNRNWIILYDDATNGLQMISADAYNNIELGYGDENYSEDEIIELDGVAGKSRVEISMHSYNNALDTLNRLCLESVTPRDGVILSVRSVGSNPINSEDNANAYFAPEAASSWFESNLNLQKRTNDAETYYVIKNTVPEEKYTIKDRDLNYIHDLDALLYLDIFKVENGNWNYFFASREAISYMDMGIIFGIRRSNALDAAMDSNVWVMQDGTGCENPSECIRPIITLNSEILNQLISASKTNSVLGDGLSSTTPWDLDSYLKIN